MARYRMPICKLDWPEISARLHALNQQAEAAVAELESLAHEVGDPMVLREVTAMLPKAEAFAESSRWIGRWEETL